MNALLSCPSELERAAPQTILRAAVSRFGPRLTLGTGLGPSGIVLMHMLRQIQDNPEIFFLETGLHFDETLRLRRRVEQRLDVTIRPLHPAQSVTAQAATHGPALWERDPDRCCALRKVQVLRRHLTPYDGWITGVRRDQGPSRAHLPIVRPVSRYGVLKISPLATWTRGQVWRYLSENDLPYNPLHDRGYPSVGCAPCTRPAAGQDERAGRWAGLAKVECGLHTV